MCLITAAQVAEARNGAERSAAQVAALYAAVTSQPAVLMAEASVAAWLVSASHSARKIARNRGFESPLSARRS